MLCSNKFTDLAIAFRFLIHFGKVNFLVWWKERAQLLSFARGYAVAPAPNGDFFPHILPLVEIQGLISGIPVLSVGLCVCPYVGTTVALW